MSYLLNQSIFSAMLAFCRIAGCFLVLPGFATSSVPAQVRLFLVIGLSVALMPIIWPFVASVSTDSPIMMMRYIFAETLIGAFMGLVVRYYMLALGFITSAIAMSIGFGSMAGPGIVDSEPSAAFGTFVSMSALMLLFTLDFHHSMILGLVASYDLVPVSGNVNPELLLSNLVDTLTDTFLIVLRLGSPFFVYALAINLIAGLLNKLTPQIPIYFVMLPFILFGGLLLTYFAVPLMLSLFGQGFSELRVFR